MSNKYISKKEFNNDQLYKQIYNSLYNNKISITKKIKYKDIDYLSELNLFNCELLNLDFLSYFDNLILLSLNNCSIKETSTKIFRAIRTLYIYNYDNLKDINMILTQFPNLEKITISNCDSVYLSALYKLEKLKEINIHNCKNIKFKEMTNKNVRILSIRNDEQINVNLDNINNFNNIEQIYLYKCNNIDCKDLLPLQNLKSISLESNKSIINFNLFEKYDLETIKLLYNNLSYETIKKYKEDIFFNKKIEILENEIDKMI